MNLKNIVPMLETANLEESIGFYTDTLGFSCEATHSHEEKMVWASMQRDQVVIMLVSRNPKSKVEKPTLTGSLYLYPDDVDVVWNELKDKTKVSYEIETFDYGMREFGIFDCNSYLLQFGQEVEEL